MDRKFLHKRWLGWGAALLAALMTAGAASAYILRTNRPASAFAATGVTRGKIENAVSAMGVLQPIQAVDVGAQVSGQLKSLRVAVGDTVKQGQLLAEIDPRILTAKVAEAEATLDNLRAQIKARQAQLTLHTREHARNQTLVAQDAVAVGEVQISEAALATTRAEIEALTAQTRQIEASLATARTNLEYTRITAPLAGIVVEVAAKEGQTLNANQQTPLVLRIADLERMTVWSQVSEADVHQMKEGLEAYFTLLGQPEQRWSGTIRQVLPTPQEINGVKFYSVLFDVANPGQKLLPLMTAQVFIVLERAEDALIIPVAALAAGKQQGGDGGGGNGEGKGKGKGNGGGKQKGGGGSANKPAKPAASHMVSLLQADGALEARPVTVGIGNAVFVQILSGLSEGEMVVTGPRATTAPGGKKKGQGGGKGKGALP